jgi:hypothetical protein
MIMSQREQLNNSVWMYITGIIESIGTTHIIYTRPSLVYVQKKLGADTTGVEVGVWDGGNAQAILEFIKPKKLYLIDPWMLYPGFIKELEEMKFGEEYFKQEKFDKIYGIVVDRFKDNNAVEVMRGMSEDRVKEFKDESVDWAYIDGSHHTEYVYKDLVNWWPKIKKGGVLCGHDFLFPGIPPALEQFSKETGVTVWPHGSDWWINK